ncbi:hypothetical protein, partial [uncultured Ruegeria sp.]|uniref:hypothetical protein n=1 Tax=uncultured Ruegeria sp. TaxID=259304 RepID=UPI002628635C
MADQQEQAPTVSVPKTSPDFSEKRSGSTESVWMLGERCEAKKSKGPVAGGSTICRLHTFSIPSQHKALNEAAGIYELDTAYFDKGWVVPQ